MNNKKNTAFLDRDGVIIEETKFITDPDKVRLLDRAADAIARLNKEYLVIIISNQPAVGRGVCTEEQAKKLMTRFLSFLQRKAQK